MPRLGVPSQAAVRCSSTSSEEATCICRHALLRHRGRAAVEYRSRDMKAEIKAIAIQERQEEARWNDLVVRLQQIVER